MICSGVVVGFAAVPGCIDRWTEQMAVGCDGGSRGWARVCAEEIDGLDAHGGDGLCSNSAELVVVMVQRRKGHSEG
ncbi:hypothetical protein M0R45_005932 [Rubus argutus]|uniref:MHC class I antigen n=1 Tax=Rubus argutus TaxID=59490 RepID=A0AAW1YPK8_RUBAR